MVNKEQYYARKAAGLCTKCGKSLEGSPSQVKCLQCHNKFKQQQKNKINTEDSNQVNKPKSNIAEKIKNLKQNTILDTTSNQTNCQLCGDTLSTFNLICQKCLKNNTFTKFDAIVRYGSNCSICGHTQPQDLKIVSSDIGKPIKQKDQELYKIICYRRDPPTEYQVQCHSCYWKKNLLYLKQLKETFDREGIFKESFLENENSSNQDVLDI